jgi:hypothetical protein
MAFNIADNGIITINRADTFKTTIFVNLGTKLNPVRYILQGNDRLYFGLMEPGQYFEHAILKKVMTPADVDPETGDVNFSFKMADTEWLHPGVYYYEIKLLIASEDSDSDDEEVDTIVPKTKFIILE